MIERELVEACKKGERKAQEMLYLYYSGKMLGVCRGYASSEEDAKDILQDGFIKVFESIGRFDPKGSLEGWIRRIIVNTAIDRYRKNVNLIRVNLDVLPEVDEIIDDAVAESIDLRLFLEMVQDLPDGCRLIFNLFVIEGYKHKEIAQMLNISEGTSKSQLYDAKQILQKKISKIYPTALLAYAAGTFKLVSG